MCGDVMGGSYPKFEPKIHLGFDEIKDTGKTKMWEIKNRHRGTKIGKIKWNGGWRKYCLFPYEETIFDTKCLRYISEFIDSEMEKRKTKKVKQ